MINNPNILSFLFLGEYRLNEALRSITWYLCSESLVFFLFTLPSFPSTFIPSYYLSSILYSILSFIFSSSMSLFILVLLSSLCHSLFTVFLIYFLQACQPMSYSSFLPFFVASFHPSYLHSSSPPSLLQSLFSWSPPFLPSRKETWRNGRRERTGQGRRE